MADLFRRSERGFDRRDENNDRGGNNFDRRYSERSGGYFDRPADGRARVNRDPATMDATLPPIANPYTQQQPVQQVAQYPQNAPQQTYVQPQQQFVQQNVQSVNFSNVVLYQPNTYNEVQEVIGHLSNHEPAIIDLSNRTDEEGQRFLDFFSGAIYALQGSMQRITGNIFLLTPTGVTISAGGDIAKSIEEKRNKR